MTEIKETEVIEDESVLSPTVIVVVATLWVGLGVSSDTVWEGLDSDGVFPGFTVVAGVVSPLLTVCWEGDGDCEEAGNCVVPVTG